MLRWEWGGGKRERGGVSWPKSGNGKRKKKFIQETREEKMGFRPGKKEEQKGKKHNLSAEGGKNEREDKKKDKWDSQGNGVSAGR